MHIKWSGSRRYWIEIWNQYEGRYDVIKANEAPMWVRKAARMDEDRKKVKGIRCIEGGGLYFMKDEGDLFRERFRLTNPDYARAARYKATQYGMPEKYIYPDVRFPSDHPWFGGIALPRFCSDPLFRVVKKQVLYDGDHFDSSLADHIKLRDYQEQAVSDAVEIGNGIIQAPCGAGKTAIGVGIIAQAQRSTLILVHSTDLLNQWVERLEEWIPTLKGNVGIIGMGKKKIGPVTIGMVQTLSRKTFTELYEIGKQFGMVIMDEAHHAPARSFVEVMAAMPARMRFGLTATPTRSDGLTKFMYWTFGEKVWSITHDELESKKLIDVPRVRLVPTTWSSRTSYGTDDYHNAITELSLCEERNNLMMSILKDCKSSGRKTLVILPRANQCEDMNDLCLLSGIRSHCMIANTSQDDRDSIVQEARKGNVDVIFTCTIADEGLDIPRLDTLLLGTPSGNLSRLEQRCGRIMRPHKEKSSGLIIDIRDAWKPFLSGAKKRDRLYRKLNIQFE